MSVKEEIAMKTKVNNKGFSLVELVIVIAIMAVLTSIVAPIYLRYVNNAKVSMDIANAEETANSIGAGIADGVIGLPAAGSTLTVTAANFPSGLSISAFPDCRMNPAVTDWTVTIDENGLSRITLNSGQEIWPNPESANGYKTINFQK